MLVFYQEGRLGNQIFQYLFLKTVGGDQSCVAFGFDELREVLEIDDVVTPSIKSRWRRRLAHRWLKMLLKHLAAKRIITKVAARREMVSGKYERESTDAIWTHGLLTFITYVETGYFQSESFFDKRLLSRLKVKKAFQEEAERFLQGCSQHAHRVFVHVRRKDYGGFTVFGRSAQVPVEWFMRQIRWIESVRSDCVFIFLSDDPDFVDRHFTSVQNKLVSRGLHFGTDFAIMTKCHSAILSPSSYGWWGAYLMQNRDLIIAPQHWLGFNAGVDYHAAPLPLFFTVAPVR